MRIAHVLTLIGAATLSLAASAEPASTASTDGTMATVNVSRPTYKLRNADLKAVKGTYALNDGRVLHVSSEQHKLYAQVDGVKTELVKTGDARFASRDDALRVSFDTADATASDVTVSTAAPR